MYAGIAMETMVAGIAQEDLQQPVELQENPDIAQSEKLDRQASQLHAQITTQCDAACAMESILSYLGRLDKTTGVSQEVINVSNIAIETLMEKVGVDMVHPISMEDFDGEGESIAKRAAAAVMQGASDAASATAGFVKNSVIEVYAFIRRKIVELARHVAKILSVFSRNMHRLEARLEEIHDKLARVTRNEPLTKYVKGENWCEYLCLSKAGFMRGLTGTGEAVNQLLVEHRQMAARCIDKYLTFMEGLKSGGKIDDLVVENTEFLIQGQAEFNRSVGFDTPKRHNVFYRSTEFPGGRAFYTQVEPGRREGVHALRQLEMVDFQIDEFDPRSYDVFKTKLAAAVAIPMSVFLTMVNPVAGAAASAATGAYLSTQGIEGTGAKVNIDKDMIFECLSLDETKDALKQVRAAYVQLENWANHVLIDPWKSEKIDELVTELIDGDDVDNNVKAYCNATLSLISHLGAGVHTYAFRVLNAILNFIEKSLKQYG